MSDPSPSTNPVTETIPSTPDPTWTSFAFTFIRTLLSFLAGIGIITTNSPWLIDSNIQLLASIIIIIAMPIWGFVEKRWIAQANHKSSVISASTGRPVRMNEYLG